AGARSPDARARAKLPALPAPGGGPRTRRRRGRPGPAGGPAGWGRPRRPGRRRGRRRGRAQRGGGRMRLPTPAPTRPAPLRDPAGRPVVAGPAPLPAVVLAVDVAGPIPSIPGYRDGRRVTAAWVLVRAFTEPLGQSIVDVPAEGVPAAERAARIEREHGA